MRAIKNPDQPHIFSAGVMGELVKLLEKTTIVSDGTVDYAAVDELDHFSTATILLIVSGKSIDASTTLDVYLEYSPDGGDTWDDLMHFAQVTNAAIADGAYVAYINTLAASAVDRVTAVNTLAANTVRSVSFCDRIRVSTVAVNFAGGDTITIKVLAFLQ